MKKIWMVTICIIMAAAMLLVASCSASVQESATAPVQEEIADEAPAPAEDESGVAGGYQPPVYEGEAPAGEVWDEAPAGDSAAEAPAPIPPAVAGDTSGESYIPIEDNTEKPTDTDSMLTFSLKVDTASYTNVERYLSNGELPPQDAVKVEELINYFNYDTPMEDGGHPMSVYTEVGRSPFDGSKYMAYVRVKAQDADRSELPPSNLVFLIDTSGSMDTYDKLPLLVEAFKMLTDNLDSRDRVSIVTYADGSHILLDGVAGNSKLKIFPALNRLRAGGSTAGSQGIQAAYMLAEKNFIEGGNNRIVLATDGDFNIGIADTGELSRFISTKRDSGIYLSTLGFGTGNLRDDMMETLAKDGNGNYSYINSLQTAQKVLVEELGSNIYTIADDVKAQVEFNPTNVQSYRLIGYENRQMANEDFDNDKKDAGEIGVGTDVVVMFELELNPELTSSSNGGTKYGGSTPRQVDFGEYGDELFEVRIRYKDPGASDSQLILNPVTFGDIAAQNSSDFNFACSVAEFGQMLRSSPHVAGTIEEVYDLASQSTGNDEGSYRLNHLTLLEIYADITGYGH